MISGRRNSLRESSKATWPGVKWHQIMKRESSLNMGTSFENAVAESFFTCINREELSHNDYDAIEDFLRVVDSEWSETEFRR